MRLCLTGGHKVSVIITLVPAYMGNHDSEKPDYRTYHYLLKVVTMKILPTMQIIMRKRPQPFMILIH